MRNKHDIIPWKCHICSSQFDAQNGGICKECNKVTCDQCFTFAKLKLVSKMNMPESQVCRVCADKKGDVSAESGEKT